MLRCQECLASRDTIHRSEVLTFFALLILLAIAGGELELWFSKSCMFGPGCLVGIVTWMDTLPAYVAVALITC
jgi:hypothetical protein